MSDPEGNSFVFPRVLMFPDTKSRETSGLYILNRFYLFKVNLFLHGAGRRLAVSLPSGVAFSLQKPLLAGYPLARIKNSINSYFILKLN